MSFVERFIILCPYLGDSTIGDCTVDSASLMTVFTGNTSSVGDEDTAQEGLDGGHLPGGERGGQRW